MTAEIARRLAAYEAHMEAIELRKAAQELRAIWVAGNEYLQAAAPWTRDPHRPRSRRRHHPLRPEPDTPLRRPQPPLPPLRLRRHAGCLHLDAAAWPTDVAAALDALPAGHRFDVPAVLFAKLDDARTADFAARYAGRTEAA